MFVNYNDYELLYLINEEGSEQAFQIMCEKYEIYINKIIANFMFSSDKRQDLLQEGYLILCRCIFSFREEENVSFFSYCSSSRKWRYFYLLDDDYYKESLFLDDFNFANVIMEESKPLTYYEKVIKAKESQIGIIYFEDCILRGIPLKRFADKNNLTYYEARKIKKKVVKEIKKIYW